MAATNWTVAEGKAKFSEMMERAVSEGPQTITNRGRAAAIPVASEEWERKTRRNGNLAEFFAASPLRSNLRVRRFKAGSKNISL
jgi:prevent-host-death family protein